MIDLVVAFGDRCGNTPGARPPPVPLRRVALVREHTVGSGARPALVGARDADVFEHSSLHCGVVDVPDGNHHPQRSAAPIGNQMQLSRQPASRASDRVIRRFDPRILAIRPSPLCPASGLRHADARARSSNQSRRPSRSSPPRQPASAPRPAASPTYRRPKPTGGTACRSSSTSRTAPAHLAMAHPCGTSTPSPRPRAGDPSTATNALTSSASTAPAQPTPRQRSRVASPIKTLPREHEAT